jgi:mycoredoxin
VDYRRWVGASGVMAALVVAGINFIQGDVAFAAMLLVLLGVLSGVLFWLARRSREGPHTSHAVAQAAAGDGDVIIYFRPGCLHCDRLKLGLGRARHDVSWVNILKDTEAAKFVAGYRGGHEAVPTAVTGAGAMIDATPAAIKAQLGSTT